MNATARAALDLQITTALTADGVTLWGWSAPKAIRSRRARLAFARTRAVEAYGSVPASLAALR